MSAVSNLCLVGRILCPIHNVVHRSLDEAIMLRRFEMSYRPSKYPPDVTRYISGTTSRSVNTMAAMTYTSVHADTDIAPTPATTSWTIAKAGKYFGISTFTCSNPEAGGSIDTKWFKDAGDISAGRVTSGSNDVNGTTESAAAYFYDDFTVGQVLSCQGKTARDGTASTGFIFIAFQPTAAIPR